MKVLVACEESQRVCLAFRKLGHDAYSCDLQDCGGGFDVFHLNVDALQLLKLDWDLVIAHPPCTYLTVSGNRWFDEEKYGDKAIERMNLREDAARFFMEFANCNAKRYAIENPVGYISTYWRKPDQIIHPWQFGDNFEKTTCLWLKGLPKLIPSVTQKPEMEYCEWYDEKAGRMKRQPLWCREAFNLPAEERAKVRSRTFQGIADAMASQWCEAIGMERAERLFV